LNGTLKTIFWWMVIFVLVIVLWNAFQAGKNSHPELTFTDFMEEVEAGHVAEVTIRGDQLHGHFKGGGRYPKGQEFSTQLPAYPDLVKELRQSGVQIKAEEQRDNPLLTVLLTWAPFLVIIGLWILFMRQMQSGGNRALSFGKSRAKLLNTSTRKVTFSDVAGCEEAKEELWEIVEFLKEPQKFQKLGGKIPKGVLLMGPPGTGKTLLARAIAGEANVPFFSISGSDFVEMFVGVGASRVRDLFEQGKKNAPCIIFIDEIDAVGRHRGAGLGGGHDEREQTLNQLLVEMDGFETNEGVILIAATNRPDVLDPALLRPGRFDRRVVVPRPDVKGREGILKVHARKLPLSEDVDLELLARGTPGFAGADLENVVNEAALLAARQNKDRVTMLDFEVAKDKVLMGSERKSMILSLEERRHTAYHEAGHVLVAKLTPGVDPVHKVSIIPRGMALGVTTTLPADERHNVTKDWCLSRIQMCFGGRGAEEIVFGHVTTGAHDDIKKATEIAKSMVCEYGMSERMGPVALGKKEDQVFLGRDFAQVQDYSEKTAQEIDEEVRRIVNEGNERAKALLNEHIEWLHAIAEQLLEKEALDGAQIDEILRVQREQRDARSPLTVASDQRA